MRIFLTEDKVRDNDKIALGFNQEENDILQGTGQLTTFNQLGIKGVMDKPDGWYIPNNKNAVAIILETKNSDEDVDAKKWIDEVKKNCQVLLEAGWNKVVGIIHNGYEIKGFYNNETIDIPNEIQHKKYYIDLVNKQGIPVQKIYDTTRSINNNLHINFGVKNLYHRMIFTACALVAQRYGARLEDLKNRDYSMLHGQILSTINKSLITSKQQNIKLHILQEVYQKIEMNYTENQNAINDFIDDVCAISNCVNSNEWRGEDVMGIFFNEFNRYKKKSEAGQVFTPEHITSLMYRLIGVTHKDCVGDFCCGSGAFLVKSMSNMMREAGGYDTYKAKLIRQNQLFGIEFDKEIYALACANMMIHKDGKTNLTQMDTRSKEACEWIKSKPITKVLMNPPFENKYGCMTIVENVLDSVKPRTECAFILPDKKLEKASLSQIKRILSNHTLMKIIKLPEPLFFGIGVTTSIFIFKSGEPQKDKNIIGYYIKDDGLETVKNQGRQDIKHKWKDIEDYWVSAIRDGEDSKYHTKQLIKPSEHLSYQLPEKTFEISEEDFKKTAMDYICFKKGIDTKELSEKLLSATLYGSEVSLDDNSVNIKIGGGLND